ncbi:MAG: alpha/beta hydrolase [Solibacterales bacterium]|nr:alpha/beta hydrolase [Bryobacterales bacterium]
MEKTIKYLLNQESWTSFQPLFCQGDLQTIAGRYWPNPFTEADHVTEKKLFTTTKDTKVLAYINRTPTERKLGTVLAVHGLAGSAKSPYMRALANAALTQGMDVVRLTVRNCDDTENLTPTLYHSGLTEDLCAVVNRLAPEPLVVIGFSMGGNISLKLAGEWGASPPAHVRGVCGISVPISLAKCAQRLGHWRNKIYETHFLHELKRTVRKKQRLMPALFKELQVSSADSIYDFDDQVTAPAFGFRDADHYYEQSSSINFLNSIRIPTLLVQAKDDPFIPFDVFKMTEVETCPYIQLVVTKHGGHVAFLSRLSPRFWMQELVATFATKALLM